NTLHSSGTTPTPYQYVGAYGYFTEPLPNLMLLWHRWYDAGTGRFGSRDPIARQGVGAYPSVRNSPVRYCDPTGLRTMRKPPITGGEVDLNIQGGGVVLIPGTLIAVPVGARAGVQLVYDRCAGKCDLYYYWCLGIYVGAGASVNLGAGPTVGPVDPSNWEGPFVQVGGSVGPGNWSGGGEVSVSVPDVLVPGGDVTGALTGSVGAGLGTPEFHILYCHYYHWKSWRC
ncbi:MAG: RHS repeat-associated core domain-containing protein, partial [Armatimonadia bacterium]